MSVDVEKLVESQMNGKSGTCQTCRWLEDRSTDERAKWDKVMADPRRWPHSAIHRAILLADPDGPKPSRNSVDNHRSNAHRRPS